MFISMLLIDVGNDPDRPRPGRLWLRNRYRVHQRLCMAFPSAKREADDPDFLKPYDPEDFGKDHVHVARKPESGFLFRIDPQTGGGVVILAQSAIKPNWEYAFHNAGYLLAAPPEVKPFDPRFAEGEQFRFRLVANPTRKIGTKSGPDGRRRHGKRVPVPADRLFAWLSRQAEQAGFSPVEERTSIQPGYVYINKTRDDRGQRLFCARYDGLLQVTDADAFRETLSGGVGPGKAFGFGLLSVAAARPSAAGETG